MISPPDDQRAFSYLVGRGVTHSIAPPMHDHVSRSLGYNWKFIAQECATVEDAVALFRKPTFAGGVVTMPYKGSIMAHLDGLDEVATTIGACNNVYRASDGSLRGTNTDWRGIKGCLLDADPEGSQGRGKPALIIGAGGASRAALYVLNNEFNCDPVYIVNRDKAEVDAIDEGLPVARWWVPPYYIVGTVPDFEPSTPEELAGRDIVQHFLSTAPKKGVLLDMCFKPRRTRWLKMAEKYGWKQSEGTGIIGHQVREQYRLWVGEDAPDRLDEKGTWDVLNAAAESSAAINF